MVDMTPDQWRTKLSKQLDLRRPEIQTLRNYYGGTHPFPTKPPSGDNQTYHRLVKMGQLNLCGLVVDAVAERMQVDGFQFGADETSGLDVWQDIWQPNHLDADSRSVHREAFVSKRSFVMVWPGDDTPQITCEDPSEVIVAYEPGSRRNRKAAYKEFCDPDTEQWYSVLLLPDVVYRWTKPKTGGQWEPWDGDDELGPEFDNPFGVPPVVEFRCRPDISGAPRGELDLSVLSIQDRINKTVFDRVVAAEFQAFPQRYVIGVENLDSNPLIAGPDRVFTLQGADVGTQNVQIGQLDAADLAPYLSAVDSDIHSMAAITKTPLYYLAASFSNISADAIRAAEAGLVKKIEEHQDVFGEAWEEVIRLALQSTNDPRASDQASQVMWRPADSHSLSETADAVVKLEQSGAPIELIGRLVGASPQEIAGWDAAKAVPPTNAGPPTGEPAAV